VVTALFLRPILNILGEVGDVRSEGQISLEKTKWLTLAGASLAVISSTAFYINFGLYVVLGDYGKPMYANPYLNALVFGINLDSVLNDIGMLLACGVVKKIACESVQNIFSTVAAHKVEPASSPSNPADPKHPGPDSKNNSDKVGSYKNAERPEVEDGGKQMGRPISDKVSTYRNVERPEHPGPRSKNISDKVGTYKNVERPEVDGEVGK
jgi:hypothetical protein